MSAAGYDARRRTLFIWEGVTQYLTPEAVRETLRQLSDAAPGSRLIFTYVRQDFIDGTLKQIVGTRGKPASPEDVGKRLDDVA